MRFKAEIIFEEKHFKLLVLDNENLSQKNSLNKYLKYLYVILECLENLYLKKTCSVLKLHGIIEKSNNESLLIVYTFKSPFF